MKMHTVETLGFDRESMFPKFHADVMAGRPITAYGAEHAQDRVAMRRFLRPHLPGVDLRSMGAEELSRLVDQVFEVFPQGDPDSL